MSAETPSAAAPATAQPQGPRWHCHRLDRGLGPHAERWAELQRSRFGDEPMFDARFVDGLLANFADGSEILCEWVLEDKPRAMCILRRRGRGYWSSFKPAQTQLGAAMVDENTPLEGLFEALPGLPLALDLLAVDPRLSGHPAPCAAVLRRAQALTMNVSLHGSWQDWLATRGAKLRSNLRRWERRCAEAGFDVQYRRIDGAEAIGDAVWRYADLEAAGWKADRGTAVTRHNRQGAFYRQLLEALAAEQAAEVHELWFDQRLVASRLVLVAGRALVFLKTTYDESQATYAPGRLLLARTLEASFSRHAGKTIEFHTDATSDLLAWSTGRRRMFDLTVYRHVGAKLLSQAARCISRWRHPWTPEPHPAAATVQVFNPLDELPAGLAALFEAQAELRGPQLGLARLRAAARQLDSRSQPRLFALSRDGLWLAALALVIDEREPGLCRALAAADATLYEPPIAPWVKAEDLRPLWHAVRDTWPALSSIRLEPMDPCSPVFGLLRAAIEDLGWFPAKGFRFVAPSIACAGLSAAECLRRHEGLVPNGLQRALRKLEATGGHLALATTAPELEHALLDWQRLWPGSEGDATETDWSQVVAPGQLHIGLARIGAQPIAAQVWAIGDGRAEQLECRTADYARGAAAHTLLTAELVRRAIDVAGVARIQYRPDDERQRRLPPQRPDERWALIAHDPRRLHGLLALARDLVQLVRTRQHPDTSRDRHAGDRPAHAAASAGMRLAGPPRASAAAPPTPGASADAVVAARRTIATWHCTVHRGIAELPIDVRRLLEQVEGESVQLGADWHTLLEASVFAPDGRTVHWHVLRDELGVLAALPLIRHGGGRLHAAANYYSALFAPALAERAGVEALAFLLRAVRRHHRGQGVIQIAPLATEARTWPLLLQALPRAGWRSFPYFAFGNWYTRPAGGWADYLAGLGSKQRSSIKRMRSKLAAEGATIEVLHEVGDAQHALAAYAQAYGSSWKSAEPYPQFVPGLVELCARRGWLRMGTIRFGERTIAAQLWIVANGRAEIYKVAYDTEFKAYSPGTVLTAAMFEHTIERDRVEEVDYLIGDDPYKKTWMDSRRERWGLVAYDPWQWRGAVGWLRELAARAVRRLTRRGAVSS
jgi:CelD/BcsL family acetyltransferase involved in cellulose biosynthesis